MRDIEKENLLKLDKEDLIQIIACYKSSLFKIGEACVDASKENRSNDQALRDIRGYLGEADRYRLYDENLQEKLREDRGETIKDGSVSSSATNQWIPVEEGLPADSDGPGPFLVTTVEGLVEGEMWYGFPGEGEDETPCFHRWDDEMWNCFIPDVIAWQQYPELYKREGKDEQ